jgi:hypothetical protein
MKTNLTIIIPVIVITILVMGLTVIPSISTDASALIQQRCLNGNGKPHPGHNQVCPPGLAKRNPVPVPRE